MTVTRNEMENYLSDLKEAVEAGAYRIELNSRRQDNRDLFFTYVIDETKVKEILLGITVDDFSEILQNEHKGFEHERCKAFGKNGKC